VLLVAINRWFWALPNLLGLAGISMTVSNASANALLLAAAPTRIRGETVSLYMLAMRGGVALGGLVTGLLVTLMGVRNALCVNGTLALLARVVIAGMWRRSEVGGEAGEAATH
jgi:MFS family permease